MNTFNFTWQEELEWNGYAVSEDRTHFCQVIPVEVNSYGLWEKLAYQRGLGTWRYLLPLLEIVILSTLLLWSFFDFLFKKLGIPIPKFTSMMLAGAALSQSSLLSHDSIIGEIFFPRDYRPKIPETLGAFGFTMYWFLEGVKMDVGMISRTGQKSLVAGITTFIVPLITAFSVFGSKRIDGGKTLNGDEYRLIIHMQSISTFTGIARLLRDLKINHSEFGRIALSSAMVAEMVGHIVYYVIKWSVIGRTAMWPAVGVLLFLIFIIWVLRPALFWVIRRTPEGRPVDDIYIYGIIILAFLSFHYWRYLRLFPSFGPFIFGLAIPHGPPLASALVERFESINIGIILPLFISFSTMQLDGLWLFDDLQELAGRFYEVLSIFVLIFAAKLVASAIPLFIAKMPLRDSVVLALILSTKGIVELSYYMYGVEAKIIQAKTFVSLVTFALLNSLFLPIAINCLYDGSKRFICYQKRNLLNLKYGSELRTLVCIHKADHIKPVIDLLEASSPSKDSPLACFVLHLIKLVGQDSPLFISHQMQKPKARSRSCSENVLVSFHNFKLKFWNLVSVDLFTSVSIPKHMHQDICSLALDNTTSLILLPFHRTWSIDQSTIVSDDQMIRNVNLNVLRRAPCSVGIFVHRKSIRPIENTERGFKVCAIFVGGKDDREALAFAKLLGQNQQVSLTIMRLVPASLVGMTTGWDQMLDMTELKDVLGNNDTNLRERHLMTYIEKTVSDGTETSAILRSAASDFNLFVLGRSSGTNTEVTQILHDWTEFEELGVLGDLLASPDFPPGGSILVMQQQQNVA